MRSESTKTTVISFPTQLQNMCYCISQRLINCIKKYHMHNRNQIISKCKYRKKQFPFKCQINTIKMVCHHEWIGNFCIGFTIQYCFSFSNSKYFITSWPYGNMVIPQLFCMVLNIWLLTKIWIKIINSAELNMVIIRSKLLIDRIPALNTFNWTATPD